MKHRTVWIAVGAMLLAVLIIAILTFAGPLLSPPVACTLIGCVNGFPLDITGSVLVDFTVEAAGSNGEHFSATCHSENDSLSGQSCTSGGTPGDILIQMTSPEVTITVRWDGGSKTQAFRPNYRTVQPNGPNCGPVCQWSDTLSMSLP